MPNPVLEAAEASRKESVKKIDELLKAAEDESRSFNDDEASEFEQRAAEVKKLDKQIKSLKKEDARRLEAEQAAAEIQSAAETAPETRAAVVNSEPGVYREDAAPKYGEHTYLRDLAAFMVPQAASALGIHPADALARMRQNYLEVERDADHGEHKNLARRIVDEQRRWGAKPDVEQRVNPNTTAGTGGEFVPPLWLVSQYVPFMRAGRVCANRVTNLPLPPGIDIINIPKITTGSLTGIQVANAAPVTSQDIVTTSVSGKVNTIAGQEDISLQLLEQSPIAMDGVVFDDLSRDYDKQLDTQILTGTGSNGQHQGALTQTGSTSNTNISNINLVTVASTVFADASTTGTQYRSIGAGKNFIETLRYDNATAIWAHPRRINNWEVTAFDTTGRPLYVPYSPYNAFGLAQPNAAYEGVAGVLNGLPTVKDGNIPTTCTTSAVTGGTGDCIVVLKEDDLYLWEGTLRLRALPEILSGTLQIRYQVYAYSAFIPSRFPPSISLLTGATGLAAPTF